MARNAVEEGAASETFYDAPAPKVSSEVKRFRLKEELEKSYEEQLKRITEAVDLKLKESYDKLLGQQIAELKLKENSDKLAQQKAERENTRLKEEITALSAQMKSNDNKLKLKILEIENQKQQPPQTVVSPTLLEI